MNAILKPFVDRAVAACAQARQASLRSDADNEKFAKAQMEGGYWLAPLKEAADYWAVEAARLQIVAHEAAQAAHGAGRAIEFAKRGEAWRPSKRRGRHERADRGSEGARPIGRRVVSKKAIPVRAALPDPDFQEVEEMDHGDGIPVACPWAARRQDGQAEGEASGSMALASDRRRSGLGLRWRAARAGPIRRLCRRAVCRPRSDRPIRSRACRRSTLIKEGRRYSAERGHPDRRERRDLLGPERQDQRQHLRPRWRTISSTSGLTTGPTSNACR